MKKISLLLVFLSSVFSSVYGAEFKVLTKATSVRSLPDGEIVGTLEEGKEEELYGRFSFWGKGREGWVNLDFTEVNLPDFTVTGRLNLRLVERDSGEVIIVSSEDADSIYGVLKGKPVAVSKSEESSEPVEYEFQIAVLNRRGILVSPTGRELPLKPGTVVLIDPVTGKVLFSGELWERLEFKKVSLEPEVDSILEEVNHLVDIFNSAKYSSPIAERLGYYVKVLPVEGEDISLVPTGDGYGVKLSLKYQLFYRDGRPVKTRKTRLIFKKSNFEFWRKVTEVCFNYGVTKFVEIDVYRYDGENFKEEGFVASSYNVYKLGKLSTTEDFMENAESELSEDLWFFADRVYEELEDGDSEKR
ncbi:MAG: hypothetical protein DSY35_01875 [Desulfurobacterium sp.]|nr:MAG: hypothetical protein DSY35_01875 [Desulfurobacterium sp.]